MSLIDISTAEQQQRGVLRRNKSWALLLLLFVAGLFVAATLLRPAGFWIELLRATAEAAVIGALADWFAVTAIFRRPLGLPIPHTAIVPRNQDRIGEGIAAFVASNFLTPELLTAKLREVTPAYRAAAYLADPAQAERLAARIVAVLPYILRSLADAELRDFAARALGEQLRGADFGGILGRSLGVLTRGAAFDSLFDRALDGIACLLLREEGTIYRMVEDRTAWWIPKAVDRKLAAAIVAGLAELLAELRDPAGERRRAFRLALAGFARDLVRSPQQRRQLEQLRDQLLDHPAVIAWLGQAWDTLRDTVLEDAASPRSQTREALARAIHSLGCALARDDAMRARLDGALEGLLVRLLVPWRHEIGRFIRDVVRGWETRTVVERLELALGPDLQYIRLTGTLVGATIGCLLYLLSAWLESRF